MTLKHWILTAVLLGTTLIAQAEPTVGFSSKRLTVIQGETFKLDLVMTGFETTEGGGLNIKFNSKVIEVEDVALNTDVWDFVNKEGIVDNDAGIVSDILFSSYKGTGDASIATITFRALKNGRSKLNLTESKINPFGMNGEELQVVLKKALVRVRLK